ncbi:Uncharacterised protein [Aeromonas salmonicida]|nr:Uncharacterised protein [Aeromonas salmonicida]
MTPQHKSGDSPPFIGADHLHIKYPGQTRQGATQASLSADQAPQAHLIAGGQQAIRLTVGFISLRQALQAQPTAQT